MAVEHYKIITNKPSTTIPRTLGQIEGNLTHYINNLDTYLFTIAHHSFTIIPANAVVRL
jgi:hypothetical protein